MKFNYDLYRPKKVIKDAWKANSAYFRSKDVQVTPLTKIGDADKIYQSQSSGRIPALARKFKPKNTLVLNEILPRRKKISVHLAGQQRKVHVRVETPAGALRKLRQASLTEGGLIARAREAGKEATATVQTRWQARRAMLSQLLLTVMVLGAGAGSVHAYISRSHATRPGSSAPTTQQTSTQSTSPDTGHHTQEAPATPPEPITDPTPHVTPPGPSSTATTSPDVQSVPSNEPPKATSSPPPAPMTPSANIPATIPITPAPPSAPSDPVTTPPPPPATPPTESPQQPTTPPTDGETDSPQTPDEDLPSTPNSGTGVQLPRTAPKTQDTLTESIKDTKPTAQELSKQ